MGHFNESISAIEALILSINPCGSGQGP